MTNLRLTFAAAFVLVLGCAREAPPYSVEDFLADRILLEATMVRCGQDRAAGRYDPNCLTAREAVDRIAAAEAKARRDALEAESERKREALRRAQDAVDERRRLAEEAEQRRRHAEEFGNFEPLPEDAEVPPIGGAPEDAAPGDASVDDGDSPEGETGAPPQTGEPAVTDEPPAGSDNGDQAMQESPVDAPGEVH